VSCGQATHEEKELGKQIAALIKEVTSFDAFLAENQTNLSALTENVFRQLNDASGLVIVMHPRGEVRAEIPASSSLAVSVSRGSVWIEQEIAIAAFREHILKRPMPVLAFIHESVAREGLRQILMLNPIRFVTDTEILEDLPRKLTAWLGGLPAINDITLAMPWHRVAVDTEHDRHDYQLAVRVTNETNSPITEFLVNVEFPTAFLASPITFKTLRDRAREPRDQTVIVIRITPTNQAVTALEPKRPTDLLVVQYFVDPDRYRQMVSDSRLGASVTLYANDREYRLARAMTEITNY